MDTKDIKQKTKNLIQIFKDGVRDTRNEIIELNMPFINYLIRKFKPEVLPYDDAFSDCLYGFTKAIETFDLNKGIEFATYVSRCMTNEMFMSARHEVRHVGTLSIDSPIATDDKENTLTLLDTIAAKEQPMVFWGEVNQLIKTVLNQFNEKQQVIIAEHLKNNPKQKEIGRIVGLEQSYVSRVIKKFYESLKKESEYQGFREQEKKEMGKLYDLSVDNYYALHDKYKTDTKIALSLGIAYQTLANWKSKNRQELIEKSPKSSENALKTTGTEKTPNHTVVSKISTKCKEQEKEIAELNRRIEALVADKEQASNKAELAHARQIKAEGELRIALDELQAHKSSYKANQDELEDAYKRINAADDLENEIAKLKDDNNDLQQQLTYAQRAQDAAEKKATDLQAQYSAATAFIVTLIAR